MTDAMLRLARAVYPQRDWLDDGVGPWMIGSGQKFDPANNADQFCDVLAWFLSGDTQRDVTALSVFPSNDTGFITHDGTASGIRAAVVEAAMRVVQGDK